MKTLMLLTILLILSSCASKKVMKNCEVLPTSDSGETYYSCDSI